MEQREARAHDLLDSFLILGIVALLVCMYIPLSFVENPPIVKIGGSVTIQDGSTLEVRR